MPVQVRFRKFIAVGQKSKEDPGPYGQGYNYVVEAGFPWREDLEPVQKAFAQVIKEVDHQHLGLDMHALQEPTTAHLCAFFIRRLTEEGMTPSAVRLERGDGLVAMGKGS